MLLLDQIIQASIWQRSTDKDTFYSVTFERRYRNAQSEWAFTYSYELDDLLLLAKLADQTHTEIMKLRASKAE